MTDLLLVTNGLSQTQILKMLHGKKQWLLTVPLAVSKPIQMPAAVLPGSVSSAIIFPGEFGGGTDGKSDKKCGCR